MEPIFTVTHIANAGLMVTAGRTRILVDAPQEGSYPFDGVPKDTLTDMLAGRGPYAGADALLFTHAHADHFSAPLVKAYLRHDPGALCVLPEAAATDAVAGGPFKAVGSDPLAFRIGDALITALPGRHIGPPDTGGNIVYGIGFGGKRLLLTGDADPECADPSAFGHADAAVVNVLFWHSPLGRHALDAFVAPNAVFIHHLPLDTDSEDKRVTFYRRMFERDLARDTAHHGYPLIPLIASGQTERVP